VLRGSVDPGGRWRSARGIAADAERDAHFIRAGFRTLRFWNNDILTNPDGMATEIMRVMKGE
jgi:very-short-patch-repair endonuclease